MVALSRRIVAVGLLFAALVPLTSASATSPPPTPDALRTALVGDARQLVIVSSARWSSTTASVSLYERRSSGWTRVAGPYSARVGRRGMKVDHAEGDGTTPAGSFPIVSAFGLRTTPGTKLPYTKLQRGDCWISDTARADYNTMVDESPCAGPNEDLWSIAQRGPYAKGIVTGYNTEPIVSGKGSAIFVHVHSRTAKGTTKPTSGCVSLSDWQLTALSRRLDPAMNPRVVMGPVDWLRA